MSKEKKIAWLKEKKIACVRFLYFSLFLDALKSKFFTDGIWIFIYINAPKVPAQFVVEKIENDMIVAWTSMSFDTNDKPPEPTSFDDAMELYERASSIKEWGPGPIKWSLL